MHDKLALSTLLDKLYQLCLTGGYGLISAYELANQYKIRYPFHSDSLDKLIKQEANKSATIGFINGLGGLISFPVTLPTNVISSLFIQMRLVVVIAILQGHNVYDKRIKTLIYFSLCMMSSQAELQHICLKTLMKQPQEVFVQISKKITQQLIVSLLTKHSIKLIKIIPLISGVTSAVINRVITYRIGQFAKRQFNTCCYV